ncbi:MAG: Fic family protein [Patescibacteria group bacterium]|jgi:Fic family protein
MKPFIPPLLPPKFSYELLIKDIGEARDALGELRGLLTHVKNHALLTAPLLTKEAVTSSSIEGTQATLEEVYRYEAEQKTSQISEKDKDIREIINYRWAMQTAVSEMKVRPIGENLLKKIHSILLNSVRGANKDRGNIRRIQVHIGVPGRPVEEARYIPPPPQVISSLLHNWENYIHSKMEKDPVVEIGVAHYQFEAIHPFTDGNGRIGRLLIPLQLYQKGILPYPVLYTSQYFERHKKVYYDQLRSVSSDNDWTGWLQFFLNAVTIQSLETKKTIIQMIRLYDNLKEKTDDMQSRYAVGVLDLIFKNPVISVSTIRKNIGAKSPQTLYNLVDKFIAMKILQPAGSRKRNQIYVFRALLKIVDGI